VTTFATMVEEGIHGIRRLAGSFDYGPVESYFEPGEPRPRDRGYAARFEAINARFPEWLGEGIRPLPVPELVEREGDLLRFPSPMPSGRPEVDRVALRLYPRPRKTSPVGVLFHHWLGMKSWLAADFLLHPLMERFPVAAMVAPHHLMRRPNADVVVDELADPNPRHVFEGFRQWIADHAACLGVLRREAGWRAVVVVGYSLGGYGALLARLVSPRVPIVAVCVTNCYARGVFEGAHTGELARILRTEGFDEASFYELTRSLHLSRWADRIGGRLTWLYGGEDSIEPVESLHEARIRLEPERVVELPGGHSAALLDRAAIAVEVGRWVERIREGQAPFELGHGSRPEKSF